MRWRDLALTVAVLLILAPFIQAQTQPVGTQGSVSGGIGRFADGTVGAPSISFINDTDTGFFRTQANAVDISAGGATVGRFESGQLSWTATANSGFALGTVGASDVVYARKAAASASINNGGTGGAGLQLTGSAVTLAIPAGALGFATAATSSVGATGQGARLVVVCGPTAGTSSLLYYSGTTNTPVVLANAVGGGLIGC